MLEETIGKKTQKVAEDAYFAVDFNEALLVPNSQGGAAIHYGWVPIPDVYDVQEEKNYAQT